MTKGNQGESCADAVRSSLKSGEVATFLELYKRIKKKGNWKDDTIWQHLICLIVNLPPARRHWKTVKPFLFLHGDGRYELYDPQKHPITIE
jgi:hypothetical protein